MEMRSKKGEYSLNEEKAIDASNHPQDQPQVLVLIIMTVRVVVKAEDLRM